MTQKQDPSHHPAQQEAGDGQAADGLTNLDENNHLQDEPCKRQQAEN